MMVTGTIWSGSTHRCSCSSCWRRRLVVDQRISVLLILQHYAHSWRLMACTECMVENFFWIFLFAHCSWHITARMLFRRIRMTFNTLGQIGGWADTVCCICMHLEIRDWTNLQSWPCVSFCYRWISSFLWHFQTSKFSYAYTCICTWWQGLPSPFNDGDNPSPN